VFTASPQEFYDALMNSRKHSEFTAAKATIGRSVSDPFSTWDDWATRVTVEVIPDKRPYNNDEALIGQGDILPVITPLNSKKKNTVHV
jgi:hypothetical protein